MDKRKLKELIEEMKKLRPYFERYIEVEKNLKEMVKDKDPVGVGTEIIKIGSSIIKKVTFETTKYYIPEDIKKRFSVKELVQRVEVIL